MLLRDLPRLYILQDPLARGPAAEASSLAGLFNKTNSAEDKHAPLSEHYVTIKSLCLTELFYLPVPGRIHLFRASKCLKEIHVILLFIQN